MAHLNKFEARERPARVRAGSVNVDEGRKTYLAMCRSHNLDPNDPNTQNRLAELLAQELAPQGHSEHRMLTGAHKTHRRNITTNPGALIRNQ